LEDRDIDRKVGFETLLGWLGGGGMDPPGPGLRQMAGARECSDESSGSCTTDFVSYLVTYNIVYFINSHRLDFAQEGACTPKFTVYKIKKTNS
jgi:hypothetical protein